LRKKIIISAPSTRKFMPLPPRGIKILKTVQQNIKIMYIQHLFKRENSSAPFIIDKL
jgi:hypothetical protein